MARNPRSTDNIHLHAGPVLTACRYIVEKILSHRFEKGAIKYEVKWEGYEKKADRTWEPEENLTYAHRSDLIGNALTEWNRENAQSCLDEYFERVGGKDKIMAEIQNGLKNKKRSRPQSNTPTSTSKRSRKNGDHPGESSPPATAKAVQWKPPAGSWEDQILELDACEDEEAGKLMVYLTWKNGARTQHETSVIYKRCPQKVCAMASISRTSANLRGQMLEFYERHVRIIKKDADNVADEAVM